MEQSLQHTVINLGMEKVVDLKHTTIELQRCATLVITNSIKVRHIINKGGWKFGKKPTEKRLPNYSKEGIFIPKFEEITFDLLLKMESSYDTNGRTNKRGQRVIRGKNR